MLGWFRRRSLKKRRARTLAEILAEQINFDDMVQRAERTDETIDTKFLETVRGKLAEIKQKAEAETNVDELDDLIQDAETQGELRAYVCPVADIEIEGKMAINLIAEWNVPSRIVDDLRNSLGQSLLKANIDLESARAALRAVFAECDSWSRYTDDYEDTMKAYTWWLGSFVLALPVISVAIYSCFPRLLVIGLMCAGAAGSCVSVISKMPLLDVSLSGELQAYWRRIVSRITAGIAASLIGTALFWWGLLPVSMQNLSFTQIANGCTSSPVTCTGMKALILLAIPMLLGFSERALTWSEDQILGRRRSP
jgi:hypothetical protein